MLDNYFIGQRLNLGAIKCDKVSHYERPSWDRETTVTIWRYAFRAPTGERFVYSGKYLGIKNFEIVSIRATIKCLRDDYGFIRLTRVKKLELDFVELVDVTKPKQNPTLALADRAKDEKSELPLVTNSLPIQFEWEF